MSQAATSTDDAVSLVSALERNEFDIAGLADFCAEQKCIDQCLRQLYAIILRAREPQAPDRKLLAQVLVGMLYVARHYYASDGHQEYWPFLFERIAEAASTHPEVMRYQSLSSPQSQALLGKWFLCALKEFEYSLPREGQTYVGPIVFHAGIPTSALHRVMLVIASACDQFGPQAITLPADIRSGLVSNHFLHRNVERLLSSNLQGAAQLWGCLARVVLAWKTLGDCSNELEQLPLALDPEEVRTALPSESEVKRGSRAALPQLRYDAESGEIRLTFPGAESIGWKVTSERNPIELAWSRTHLGQTAEFKGPLPEQIIIQPTDLNAGFARVFSPYPSNWPGYWFHAHNGHLEDGQAIDSSGLNSGRWYAIFEGTPSKCSVPFVAQCPLKLSWFSGNQEWTAWEVEVPPRTLSRTHLEWCIGDNRFRVPLAQRPGPRLEFIDYSETQAVTLDGTKIDVFAAAPAVILRRESPLSLQLIRESIDSVAVVDCVTLKPETATQLPVAQAGIYQLRELRGVGRTLLRFAIVPQLKIQGPDYDGENVQATVCITADSSAGEICEVDDVVVTNHEQHWSVRASTVEPFLKVRWQWSSDSLPHLEFRWPIEALRWRVTDAGDEYSGWTREPLFISPKMVAESDAQLEVQTPAGSDLRINGETYTGRVQASPSGNTCVVSLLPYGETVELESEGQRYAAVLQSERPLIDSFQGDSDGKSLIVTWRSAKTHAGMSMVSWDPCEVLSSPKAFSITASQVETREWAAECDDLPGKEWTSISLARSVGGFFQKVHHLAARRSDTLEPISLLLNRLTGEVQFCHGRPATWPEFLHRISLLRLYRSVIDREMIAKLLKGVACHSDIDMSDAIQLLVDLDRQLAEPATNDRDRNWADAVYRAVLSEVRRTCRENPGRALSNNNDFNVFGALLILGVPVGRFYPFRSIATGELPVPTVGYPLAYIRDLWLLGTGRKQLEYRLQICGDDLPQAFDKMQACAAERLLDFHEKFNLPPISAFLPINARTATTALTDQGHQHSFALPPLPPSIDSPDKLCGFLGLQDKAIDCQATVDDPFYDTHSRGRRVNDRVRNRSSSSHPEYSLYWSVDENRWAIETLSTSPPTCCFTKTQPLVVEPISQRELASTIAKSLAAWTKKESPISEPITRFEFLNRYQKVLAMDKTSGALHAEIFKPAVVETKELFGRMIPVETRPGLPPLAMIAWQLAWMERALAWENEQDVFKSSDDNSASQREFLSALAVAIVRWPELMQRTIALAELVYWTLYRGGIGAAVRFQSEYTDDLLSDLEGLPQAAVETLALHSAPNKPADTGASNVPGIIVGYDAGIGTVLLCHRNSKSLETVLRDYKEHGDAERHWFASFKWRSIPQSARERIQEMQSKRSSKGNRPQYLALADVMCGMRVMCKLEKKPKWEAVEVSVDFGTPIAQIPRFRRR